MSRRLMPKGFCAIFGRTMTVLFLGACLPVKNRVRKGMPDRV